MSGVTDEDIARIIDPEVWKLIDGCDAKGKLAAAADLYRQEERHSLAKANSILSLLSNSGEGKQGFMAELTVTDSGSADSPGTALEAAARQVSLALENSGYPVSLAALPALLRAGSREAIALNDATNALRIALGRLPPPAISSDREGDGLGRLRGAGWVVAVHNDYRLDGEPHTFWLLTHPDGRYVKGEGRTDAAALAQCELSALPTPGEAP